MAFPHSTKPPPMEINHISNQINSLPVGPASEPQKREIVAKLHDLASQMKHWAAQVEGFASMLNTFSIVPGHGHPQKQQYSEAEYSSRGPPPNGHTYMPYANASQQQYANPNSQQYQFQVQQYQPSGRRSAGAPNSASPPMGGYLGTAEPPEASQSHGHMTPTPEANEKSGKRRRKSDGPKRKKDPLAPKRPPSAYILYQNDVRKEMQDKHQGMLYSEVLGKISESWQTLEESKKKVYLDMVERDKVRYEDEKLRYNSGVDVPTKPTPRRPLSSLRAPSDADADAEAEIEDGDEETEGIEQEEQEPEMKRTKLEGVAGEHDQDQNQLPSEPQSQSLGVQPQERTPLRSPTPSSLGYPQPQSQSQSQVAPPQVPIDSRSPAQFHAQAQAHHYATPHIQYPSQVPQQQQQQQRAPSQVSQASQPGPSPQMSHVSPHISHVSPQVAHATPHQAARTSPHEITGLSPHHVTHASPHQAHVSPQQAHLQPRHPGAQQGALGPHLTSGMGMGVPGPNVNPNLNGGGEGGGM